MKKIYQTEAKELPVYERVIAVHPHLAGIKMARPFCNALCMLAALDTISIAEYWEIGRIAAGREK